ncbi:MAG: TIGR01777 family oxidoreductase [Shewanella sp.]|nr:TIGR01777 family oxidoreductase [Shewanella sp.]MCF1431316.1 TIGR01777 family oxidoreductase [Shewanella sp.]MCF1438744.1 TIGR01777 family oxidoreductase [Shewanella sp.]MCF1456709.1 TIGR01777 family oxidoreductase [Shewanella sp.]
MNILITGATGFIGQALVSRLAPEHTLLILTRNPQKAARVLRHPHCSFTDNLDSLSDLNGIDAVINLAGEPIVGKRWSPAQKQRLCHSRWDITQQLAELIRQSDIPPPVFISASAVGFYGIRNTEALTESSIPNPDFAHEICAKWEALALSAANEHTRVCIPRIGIVLGSQGGALAKMLPAFKLGLGGPISDGKQGMSWIHLEDLLSLLEFMLKSPTVAGIYNAVAPGPVSNREFTQTLGQALHRPAIVPAPAWVLNSLLGEQAMLLTKGQYVMPERALAAGFNFRYPRLSEALAAIVQN